MAGTCLKFPFFLDIHAYDNQQKGFESISKNFNGLEELLSRNDAGVHLIRMYEQMDLADPQLSEKDKLNFLLGVDHLELIIFQDRIIQKLTRNEVLLLRNISIRQFEAKQKQSSVFGTASLNITALILAKLLKQGGKEDLLLKTNTQANLDIYFSTTKYSNQNIQDEIYRASKSL